MNTCARHTFEIRTEKNNNNNNNNFIQQPNGSDGFAETKQRIHVE